MSFQLKGLREQRAAIRTKIEAIGSRLKTEQRAMSSEEKAAFEQLKTDWADLNAKISAIEADIQAIDAAIAADEPLDQSQQVDDPAPPPADPGMTQNGGRRPKVGRGDADPRGLSRRGDGASLERARADRALALQAWARSQHGLSVRPEHREACKRLGINPRSKFFDVRLSGRRPLVRGLTVGTTTAGGYTVPEGFSGILEQALLDYSAVRGVADVMVTAGGGDMPYPTEDDTSNTGELLGEATEANFADNTFGVVTFRAYKFSSKGVLVSYELLNDSAFNLEEILGTQLGIRIARIQGDYFTTGTGTSQPHGIVTASSLGVTTASATAFTADELTRLAFSVDPAYRKAPTCGYMMHDTAMAYAMLLKDGENRPLFRESYRDGITFSTINGFPVFLNQYMAQCSGTGGIPVTAKKHVLFGDMSKFKIRDVGAVRIRRLDERYAEKDQVGFIGFLRSDSRCVNTSAIKHLLQA